MPVEFLSDDRAASYGRFVGDPSQTELERCFFLDGADRALVDKRRGEHNRLGFAVALCTLPWLGFVPDEVAAAPRAAVARLAEQLQVDPDQVRSYGR